MLRLYGWEIFDDQNGVIHCHENLNGSAIFNELVNERLLPILFR